MIRFVFLISLAACLVSAPARAAPPVSSLLITPRLEYIRGPGAESCPEEQDLRDLVAAQLGGADPFVPDAAHRLTVTLTGRGRDFYGNVALYDGAGQYVGGRNLPGGGPTCSNLVQDLAISISLTLSSFVPVRPPSAPPLLAPPAPPRSPQATTQSPDEPRSAATRVGPEFGAGAMMAFGSTPSAAAGFGGFVRIRWAALPFADLSVALEGRGELPLKDTLVEEQRISGSLAAGSGVVCLHHKVGLAACGLLSIGAVTGSVMDHAPDDQVAPYVGTGLRLALEMPFARYFVGGVHGDLLGNAVRPAVLVDHEPVWTAEYVTGVVGLRLGATFF